MVPWIWMNKKDPCMHRLYWNLTAVVTGTARSWEPGKLQGKANWEKVESNLVFGSMHLDKQEEPFIHAW